MSKRYQVFLSSTFVDLQDERREVLSALQKAGFFVAGMELFPSDDDESWEVIKRVIDQSDYYVLVIAGRYGSIGKDGRSFTEMEYDYAKRQGLPVLAFFHGDPSSLPSKNIDSENFDKLKELKSRVEKSHNRRSWSTKHDLAVEILASLSQTVNLRPRIGWVRGTAMEENESISRRFEELSLKYERIRDERDSLAKELETIRIEPELKDVAWDDDEVKLTFDVTPEIDADDKRKGREAKEVLSVLVTWERVFELIATDFIGWNYANKVGRTLTPVLLSDRKFKSASMTTESLHLIRTQLIALGLIHVETEERDSGIRVMGSISVELWRLSDKALREYAIKHALRRANE
jgi:hypothetical protein